MAKKTKKSGSKRSNKTPSGEFGQLKKVSISKLAGSVSWIKFALGLGAVLKTGIESAFAQYGMGGSGGSGCGGSGGSGGYSDARLKDDVVHLDSALALVKKLRGVRFTWKESGQADVGLIAQELEKVLPELVQKDQNGIRMVKYGHLSALAIESIKHLDQAMIDQKSIFADQLGALESRILDLEKKSKK